MAAKKGASVTDVGRVSLSERHRVYGQEKHISVNASMKTPIATNLSPTPPSARSQQGRAHHTQLTKTCTDTRRVANSSKQREMASLTGAHENFHSPTSSLSRVSSTYTASSPSIARLRNAEALTEHPLRWRSLSQMYPARVERTACVRGAGGHIKVQRSRRAPLLHGGISCTLPGGTTAAGGPNR
jgi:hypothetical protein